jgi:hypothetical protein
MKAKWNGTSVFVTMVSSDCSYAIVTKNKDKVSGQFKVDLVNLSGLNTNDILKLQKFKYENTCNADI